MEFVPIASSSAGCAYIVRTSGMAPLLIDCGVRFELIRQALDFKVSGLAACLVSHGHGDHCKAVPDLLKAGVRVYSGAATWEKFPEGIRGHHRAVTVQAMEEFKVGPWAVKAFDAVHDAEDTLGFIIAAAGEKLLYLTDTGWSKYRFEGLTHIAIECNWGEEILRENSRLGILEGDRFRRTASTHMSLERLLKLLQANDLTSVREIHLLHLSDANSDEQAFADAVRRATGKPTYVAAKREVPF